MWTASRHTGDDDRSLALRSGPSARDETGALICSLVENSNAPADASCVAQRCFVAKSATQARQTSQRADQTAGGLAGPSRPDTASSLSSLSKISSAFRTDVSAQIVRVCVRACSVPGHRQRSGPDPLSHVGELGRPQNQCLEDDDLPHIAELQRACSPGRGTLKSTRHSFRRTRRPARHQRHAEERDLTPLPRRFPTCRSKG